MERGVIVHGLVMEHTVVLHVGRQAQINTDHVTGVALVFLHCNHVGKGIHGIKDHEVGIPIEINHSLGGLHRFQLMFAIRRINDTLAVLPPPKRDRVARSLYEPGV